MRMQMFNILVWCVYGLFVGSIAKSIVPGEERMGFFQTVAIGVAGSYMGGAILYLFGQYDSLSPSGIIMGIAGGVVSLVVYNKLTSMHFYAWEKGLKTGIYYLRRKAKHQAQQFTIEPETKQITEETEEICEMCSA